MPRDRGMHGTLRYAALALAVAACGGPVTGPRPVAARLANPATTFNQLQAISAVTNTPLFESFTVLAPRFTPASATGSVALAGVKRGASTVKLSNSGVLVTALIACSWLKVVAGLASRAATGLGPVTGPPQAATASARAA